MVGAVIKIATRIDIEIISLPVLNISPWADYVHKYLHSPAKLIQRKTSTDSKRVLKSNFSPLLFYNLKKIAFEKIMIQMQAVLASFFC